MEFRQEAALVIYKNELIDLKIGESSSVEFDFERIWDFKRQLPIFEKDRLHFFHTHAPDWNFCSETDVRCMKALNIAFGYPVNFWILVIGNNLKQYRFVDNEVKCRRYIHFEDFMNAKIEFEQQDTFFASNINIVLSSLSRFKLR
jgi:hypothetical protein